MAITDPPPWGWQWPPQQNFAWPGPQTFHLGGWRCPGCGRCWNPSVLSCEHRGPNPAIPAEDFTGGLPAPVAYGEIEASHGVSDLCVPVSEGGLCDHDDEPQQCTGGRHCGC